MVKRRFERENIGLSDEPTEVGVEQQSDKLRSLILFL